MPVTDWTPTVADVGSVLRARTVDTNGVEQGTFTTTTRPSGTDVAGMVGAAAVDVYAATGNLPPVLWPAGRRIAAIGTALLVELSYFPDAVGSANSPYDRLKALYDELLARLVDAASDVEAGGEVVPGVDVDHQLPAYYFGDDVFDGYAPGTERPLWPIDGPGPVRRWWW